MFIIIEKNGESNMINKELLIPDKSESWKSEQLKKILVFPVTAYKKENGFLALISYNWNTDELLIC